MSESLTVVMVTYHSTEVAGRAIRSFREEAARAGIDLELVVVDHSGSDDERAALVELGPDRIIDRPNLGYAAGINAGLESAHGDVVILANPDVCLGNGSLAALLAALGHGFGVVGPQFTYGPFLLPPAEIQTPAAELRRWRALASRRSWSSYMSDESRRCLGVWTSSGAVAVATLSGALLAMRRSVLDDVGRWDEGYFLYFEETDWLRRAARRGHRFGVVASARVEHAWGHAAGGTAARRYFAPSRRRYLRRHFGVSGAAASLLRQRPLAVADGQPPEHLEAPEVVWLASPSPWGFPAAGHLATGDRPDEALTLFAGHPSHASLVVTAVDTATLAVLGTGYWGRDAG